MIKWIILTLLLITIVITSYYIYNKYRDIKIKESFIKKYEIDNMVNRLQIKITKEQRNKLILKFPMWNTKCGDINTEEKEIITKLSELQYGNIKVTCKYPQYIYNLALKIRKSGGNIPYCKEEQDKIDKINEYKRYTENIRNITDLKIKYCKNKSEFNQLCKILFKDYGIDITIDGETLIGTFNTENEKEHKVIIQYNLDDTKIEKSELQAFKASCSERPGYKMFIAIGKFNTGAINYAKRGNIRIIDGEEIIQMVKQFSLLRAEKLEFMGSNKYELTYSDVEQYYPSNMPYDWV